MNRELVIKGFFSKVFGAKRQNLKELRMSILELENIAVILQELLVEYFNNTIENNKNREDSEDLTISGGSF